MQSGLDVEGAMVAAAIAQTEGGLTGAVGDRGQSFGPFQFHTGGQLRNFARDMGVSLAEAGQLARTRPDVAVQWALRPGGYLGDSIRTGQRQGLHGAQLATYAQHYGQVSVSPERAGTNFNALWANGQGDVPTTVDLSNGTARPSATQRIQIAPGLNADVQPMDLSMATSAMPISTSNVDNWIDITQPPSTRRLQIAPGISADVQPFDFSTFASPQSKSSGAPRMQLAPGLFGEVQSFDFGDLSNAVSTGTTTNRRTPATRESQWTMGKDNQILTAQEAAAWCGPDAAMAFAQSYGRNPTLGEAKQIAASQNLWSADVGMHGPQSESQLISDFGVPNTYEPWSTAPNWTHVQTTLSSGQPVILSTPKHYFYATQYDPTSDRYFMGTSGTDVRAGSEWWSPTDISSYSPIQGAIYANAP